MEVSLARPLPDKKPSHGGGDHTNPSSQRREERSSHHSHSVYHQSSRAGPAVSHGHGHEREREREREDRVGGVGGSSWPYGYRGGDRSERGHERGRDRVGERVRKLTALLSTLSTHEVPVLMFLFRLDLCTLSSRGVTLKFQ